ncbi:MAG: ATP-binding protein [Pseudomonadota bacterium]
MIAWLSRSLAVQIVALLTVTLLIAQTLNLALLIGERRAVARDAHYDAVIDRIVEEALIRPEFRAGGPPIVLASGRESLGAVYLASHPLTPRISDGEAADVFRKRLEARLLEAELAPVQVLALKRRVTPGRELTRPPPTRPTGLRRRDPGPPINGPRPGPPPQVAFPPGGPRNPVPPHARAPHPINPGLEEIVFSVELSPGVWINATAPHYATEALTARLFLSTGLTILCATVAALLLTQRVVAPIRDLAEAADALGQGDLSAPIIERGPADVRKAARAFNRMQERLTRVINDQRVTLRALGHDLRTPLTALRLRVDALPSAADRDRLATMVDSLSAMTEEILSWAKVATAEETAAPVDLGTLLDSLAADYQEQGRTVTYVDTAEDTVATCRPLGLKRAITNLVENALAYGSSAELSIERSGAMLTIHVDDSGPGIPAEQLDWVTEPFNRLESSRNRNTGGMGLGLSIVQSIVLANGGELSLSNREPTGLRASIRLQSGRDTRIHNTTG